MRIVLPVVASIVILGLIGTQEANAEAVTNISTCQNLSIPRETYVLTRDIVTTGNCFIITADGITLDGNGHKIVGDGSGILGDQAGDIGVDIISATGVTVQNLDISFFRSGVFLQSSNGNTVTNNLIHQISKYGVGLDGSSNNIISSNFFDIAIQHVVPMAAVQQIVAAAALQRILAARAAQRVVAGAADQQIPAAVAGQHNAVGRRRRRRCRVLAKDQIDRHGQLIG